MFENTHPTELEKNRDIKSYKRFSELLKFVTLDLIGNSNFVFLMGICKKYSKLTFDNDDKYKHRD